MYPEVLTGRDCGLRPQRLIRRLGDRLGAAGYRGFFEVDVLVDTDADEVYLGELNPRISGASAITNVTAGAYADMPLFAFHLLEFMDVDFELRPRRDQRALGGAGRGRRLEPDDHQGDRRRSSSGWTRAALTGQYSLDGGGALVFRRAALDWHQLQNESEAFFLRIYGAGDYRWKGADLGVLVTKGRLQRGKPGGGAALTIRAKQSHRRDPGQYSGVPLVPPSGRPSGAQPGSKSL